VSDVHFVDGFCPACGRKGLNLRAGGLLVCVHPDCSAPDTAAKILSDPEIHHIVRFGDGDATFNAQHPLRERAGRSLLDCKIHEEVWRWKIDGNKMEGTWRVKEAGEHNLDANYIWERIGA
jgi:hypothetical protein